MKPLKHEYQVSLLTGNHGIWLFVRGDDGVLFEQAGLKTPAEALKYALAVIEYEERSNTKDDLPSSQVEASNEAQASQEAEGKEAGGSEEEAPVSSGSSSP